jgi:hypothetical protein
LGIALVAGPSGLARPRFHSSEIEGRGSEIIFCDLNGDHLKDAVLIDGLKLSIFCQDSKRGFTREPQQQYRLDDRPAVVWPARLGRTAESLLIMTSEGVTELCFTNRTGPPARRQIIKQQTVIPDSLEEPSAMYLPLSADTGSDWPLVLVPVDGGLQVWKHGQEWSQTQTLERTLDTRIWPSVTNPGYTKTTALDLCVGDINGDRRDDLIIRRSDVTGKQTYAVYLQRADGQFGPEPALTYESKSDWRSWLCWVDLNRDGKVDLVKNT